MPFVVFLSMLALAFVGSRLWDAGTSTVAWITGSPAMASSNVRGDRIANGFNYKVNLYYSHGHGRGDVWLANTSDYRVRTVSFRCDADNEAFYADLQDPSERDPDHGSQSEFILDLPPHSQARYDVDMHADADDYYTNGSIGIAACQVTTEG